MPGVLKKRTKDGRYIAWFKSHRKDASGRRVTRKIAGTHSYEETRMIAIDRQSHEDRIRLGLIPAPKDQPPQRDFVETVERYLANGEASGGRGGGPWSEKHARTVRTRLAVWHERAGFESLRDLENGMALIGDVLAQLGKEEKNRKIITRARGTVHGYKEALSSFCSWCVDLGFLSTNPVARLRKFRKTPEVNWRALTPAEAARILAVAPPERVLIYETALFTGFRAGELRHLTVRHLDLEGGRVRYEGAWTKNGESGFQTVPQALLEKLAAAATSDNAPLLRVPSHTARTFDRDLLAAGIEKENPHGKLVFHSWRGTFATWLDLLGATPTELQELMRHATPQLAQERYVQARTERQNALLEEMLHLLRGAGGVSENTDAGPDRR